MRLFFCGFIVMLSVTGCSSSMYNTNILREDGLLGIPYYKTVEVSGVLTLGGSGQANTIDFLLLPKNKSYLYVDSSPLFGDTVEFKITETGLPASSDTDSKQELTSVLNDLGTVAGKVGGGLITFEAPVKGKPKCEQLKKGVITFDLVNGKDIAVPIDEGGIHQLKLEIEGDQPVTSDPDCNQDKFKGFCAYEPTPVKVMVTCSADGEDRRIIAGPKVVNSYRAVRLINPKRNFLTNRREIYTMTNGVITYGKYVGQSYVKGLFDLLLSPAKAVLSVLPTSQTTTQTQIQTGGGKPDQATTTNTVIVSMPK